jgi:DNA repair protein RadA/Sms
VLLSIVSSLKNKPLDNKLIVFGEVGLAGEVRPVTGGLIRLKEAAKLGFTQAIVPKPNAPKTKIPGLEVIAVDRLEQALNALRQR